MNLRKFLLPAILFIPAVAGAEPNIFADEITNNVGFTNLDTTPSKNDGCSVNEGIMRITGSQYSKSGRYIELLKFTRRDGQTFVIPTNFEKLSNADISRSEEISKTGSDVFVKFSTCGSGGYQSLIDILKPI